MNKTQSFKNDDKKSTNKNTKKTSPEDIRTGKSGSRDDKVSTSLEKNHHPMMTKHHLHLLHEDSVIWKFSNSGLEL